MGDKDGQIAVQYMHITHPGREAIGIPVVHKWLKNNSRTNAQRQWDDLFAAMGRGDIVIDSERSFLTTAHMPYTLLVEKDAGPSRADFAGSTTVLHTLHESLFENS